MAQETTEFRPATRRPSRPRSRAERRARQHAVGSEARRRDGLIERYLPLAEKVAARYRHTKQPLEDLVQVARLGLIKAVERWDPGRGTAFSTFAVPTITGELRRYFRDSTWLVRPPRDLQELALSVGRARDQLWQELGREPTAADVADRVGRTVEEVLDALQAGDAYSGQSLDAPLHDDDAGSVGHDVVVDRRVDFTRSEDGIALEQLSAVLNDREREVVRLRFGEDLPPRQIAERVGCSQMQVSRILGEALGRLQAAAQAQS